MLLFYCYIFSVQNTRFMQQKTLNVLNQNFMGPKNMAATIDKLCIK